MKLLKKSIVMAEVAGQRKNQIDEGVAIAKKVDALRQTLGSLEQQHKQFLDGMQNSLKEKCGGLERKIADLEWEINQLEIQRAKLLEPLDIEIKRLEAKDLELTKREQLIVKSLEKIEERKVKAEDYLKESKDKLQTIKLQERELAKAYKYAEDSSDIIKGKISDLDLRIKISDEYFTSKNQEMLEREAKVAVREREVSMLQDSVALKEKELIRKTILVTDREQTLEREINRQNNGNSRINTSNKYANNSERCNSFSC